MGRDTSTACEDARSMLPGIAAPEVQVELLTAVYEASGHRASDRDALREAIARLQSSVGSIEDPETWRDALGRRFCIPGEALG
jgi:hypothetical protein